MRSTKSSSSRKKKKEEEVVTNGRFMPQDFLSFIQLWTNLETCESSRTEKKRTEGLVKLNAGLIRGRRRQKTALDHDDGDKDDWI